MNEANAAVGSVAAEKLASREKHWEECSPEQQIDRLRDEVARLCGTVTELYGVVLKLSGHIHGNDGKIAVPFIEGMGNRLDRPGLFAHDNGIPHRLRKPHERR